MKVNNLFGKGAKLQSAMEYLITYGWAILVLAIVISLLFALGVFSSNNNTNLCVINQGFGCLNYYMNTNGIAVLTITQTTATYINITGIGCSSDPNNEHVLAPQTASRQVYLAYGSAYNFTVQCYTASGIPSLSLGQTFYGSIYINYINDVNDFPGSAAGKLIITPSVSGAIKSPSEILAYLPITITNYQSVSVPSGFQQMIYFNPSLSIYSSNEMLNLSNIEFTTSPDGIGTPINAWIESGASSSSTNTVLWISLPQGIASNGGTETIYMNFLNNNAPVTYGYTGYAPQLWCASGCFQKSYAEYDNGPGVFNFYDNFSGTSLDSKWQVISGSGTGVVVDNGLSVSGNYIQSYYSFNSLQYVLDEYAGFNSMVEYCENNYGTDQFAICSEVGYSVLDDGGPSFPALINPMIGGDYYLTSLWMGGSSSNTLYGSLNYGAPSSTIGNNYGGTAHVRFFSYNSLGSDIAIWVRVRNYPPNGVMPGFVLGNPIS